jgi:hypothetical protein
MKLKAFIVAAALVLFAACGEPYRATNTSVVVVPDGIQTSFATQYPGATNVVWLNYDPTADPMIDWDLAGWEALDANDYVVRYDMNGDNYYSWYDSNGDWVGTAYVVRDYATLPSAVSNTLNTQFSDYSITKVEREFHKDRVAFEVVITRSSDNSKVKMLIDANGNIIKQKTKF